MIRTEANHPYDDVDWKDLRPVLDEELCRLSEKHRAPLLLCYVEGKSHQEAAQQLDWPITVVYSRLARGRELLRTRLSRRGIAPTVALGALAIEHAELVAAVPPMLAATTVRLAVLVSAGQAAAVVGMAPTVATLVKVTTRAMFIGKLKIAAAAMVTISILATSAGVLAYQVLHKKSEDSASAELAKSSLNEIGQSSKITASVSPMLTVYAGETSNVCQSHSVAFSPDGTRLAAMGQHGLVWLWDAATGKELFTYRATFGPTSISFSPDGKYVACCKDGGVTLWEIQIGRPRAFLTAKTFRASEVSYHPKGEHLAMCTGNEIVLWDLTKQRDLVTLRGHSEPVTCAIIAPTGNSVASASKDGTVRLWDFETGKETSVLQRGRKPVDLHFCPNGKSLAVADRDEGITVYDVGDSARLLVLPGKRCVTYSPDGKLIVGASANPTGGDDISAWDSSSGKKQWMIQYGKPVADIAFNPDGERIATVRTDALVEVWDITAASSQNDGNPISITARPGSPMPRPVMADQEDWTGERRKPLLDLSIQAERRIRKNGVRFSPDGSRLAATTRDGQVHVWDANKGHEVFQTPAENAEVWCVSYSPDGGQIATSNADGTVKMWNAETGQLNKVLTEKASRPSSVAYRADSVQLTIGDFEGVVRFWDVTTGTVERTMRPHTDRITAMAYSPDGKCFASGDLAGVLRLWSTDTDAVLRTIKEPHSIGALAISPNGQLVATAAEPGRALIVRELSTGRAVHHLPGEKCVAFSPDGRWVASAVGKGSNDVEKLNQGKMYEGEIRIWNASTGSLRLAIRDDADITDLSFSPKGDRLAAATNEGFVKLWDVADLGTVAEPVRSAWQKFVSSEGRFHVMLPGLPKTRNVKAEDGLKNDLTQHTAYDGGANYTATYEDTNEEITDPSPTQVVDSIRDVVIKKLNGKLVTEKDLQLGPHPVREIHIDTGNGNLFRTRVCIVKMRRYQVGVHGPKEVALSMTADRFLDSFGLVEK